MKFTVKNTTYISDKSFNRPALNLKKRTFLFALTMLSINTLFVTSAKAANNEGWFEIEVILLEQLSDKAKLKETFTPSDEPRGAQSLLKKYLTTDPDNNHTSATDYARKKVTKKKAGNSSAYRHKKNAPTLDLLSQYIKPDFSHIKSLLDVCDTTQLPFYNDEAKREELFNLTLIENFHNAGVELENSLQSLSGISDLNGLSDERKSDDNEEWLNNDNRYSHNPSESVEVSVSEDAESFEPHDEQSSLVDSLPNATLSALLQTSSLTWAGHPSVSAENLFVNIDAFIPAKPCVFSNAYFDYTQSLNLSQNAHLSTGTNTNITGNTPGYYDLNIESMPLVINAAENIMSTQPYLLNEESLQLSDIRNELKQSRYFKPLLHLGWRQYTLGRYQATPLKIMAGANIQSQYEHAQKSLQAEQAAYLSALAQAKAEFNAANEGYTGDSDTHYNVTDYTFPDYTATGELSTINTVIHPADTTNESQRVAEQSEIHSPVFTTALEKAKSALLQQHLADIFSEANQPLPPSEQLMQGVHAPLVIDEKALKQVIEAGIGSAEQSELEKSIQDISPLDKYQLADAPSQAWYLQGLFTVHVNHYLHITADVNIMNKATSADDFIEQKTTKNTEVTRATKYQYNEGGDDIKSRPFTVNFQQDRRVISKEIHYFDHPYMGMIVQIRRYTPPEPESELESELVESEISANKAM